MIAPIRRDCTAPLGDWFNSNYFQIHHRSYRWAVLAASGFACHGVSLCTSKVLIGCYHAANRTFSPIPRSAYSVGGTEYL